MAMANYEGMAFLDGDHWHKGCTITLPNADAEDGWPHRPHAVVGDGAVRVGVHKTMPMLYRYEPGRGYGGMRLSGRENVVDADGNQYVAIGVEAPLGGPGVAILVDPDGAIWTAVGAYEAYDDWCEEAS